MPNIEFKNICFSYSKTRNKDEYQVFEDFNISFIDNSFNVLLGPSGSGKTTLLRLLTGFLDDYEGDIFIDNVNTDDLSVSDRNLAFINQNYVLYPHLSVFDNIAFPLKALGASREEIIARVNEVAEELDLVPTLSRKPKYLSGGQQQRVALARGIVKNAKIYLFDEPLSNVDQMVRVELRQYIKKVVLEHHATAIYVTHDFNEAMAIADYMYVINEGKLVVSGKPIDVYQSNNPLINEYIKASTISFDYEKKSK